MPTLKLLRGRRMKNEHKVIEGSSGNTQNITLESFRMHKKRPRVILERDTVKCRARSSYLRVR